MLKIYGGTTRITTAVHVIDPIVVPMPNYWWRADSGLTSTGWTAVSGGINFGWTGSLSISSVSGVAFTGSTATYGTSSVLPVHIDVRHILIRYDNEFSGSSNRCFMGSTLATIHELLFYAASANTGQYLVQYNDSGSGLSFASSGGIAGTQLTWIDFVNNSVTQNYYDNGDIAYRPFQFTTYFGTWPGYFRFVSGTRMILGNRGLFDAPLSASIKEIAIFTSSLSAISVQQFRNSMYTRWP